jgi:hypothetical protein
MTQVEDRGEDAGEEMVVDRVPREVERLLREITEREPDIESLWVRNDPEPRSWPSMIYSLVEAGGFIIEVRVRYFDVNREGFAQDHRCLIDKIFDRDAPDEKGQGQPGPRG